MPRYIDADKFKGNLERAMEKMHLIGGVKGVDVGAVIVALDRQPTADVAPRAEVAKEIFAEIRQRWARRLFECGDFSFKDFKFEGFAGDLDKLFKKYTEEDKK